MESQAPTTPSRHFATTIPHDASAQRQVLHRLIDTLPTVMLGPTLALLLAGPRYLLGISRTTPGLVD